jgi:glycosyltransferase involved in cell wall biosynthesis
VKAVEHLRKKRDDCFCYIVGLRDGDPYSAQVNDYVNNNRLAEQVRLIPETADIYPYYRAGEIFICTSHIEGYSRTILEAEAFGLPIITTLCGGIAEQVRGDVNALLFGMCDSLELAQHIERLLDDKELRLRMGRNSRGVFEYLISYNEMLERYEQLIIGGCVRSMPLQSQVVVHEVKGEQWERLNRQVVQSEAGQEPVRI